MLVKLRRQQEFQRLSENLLRPVPENLFGALIEQDDFLVFIDRNDGVGGDFENFPEQFGRSQQLIFRPTVRQRHFISLQ
jgi:hypothetical protein